MSGNWQCYGWDGNFCHTGSNFFASDKDGLCFKDTDVDFNPTSYPFELYFAALNKPSQYHLNRKIVVYFNGDAFDTMEMENSWNYIWYHLDFAGKQNSGLYTFKLVDGDSNILCEKSCYVGEETATPSPELPAKEDYTDYTKIENIVKNSDNLVTLTVGSKYKTLEESLGYLNTNLSGILSSNKDDIENKVKVVDDHIKKLSSSFEDKFNLDDGIITSYLNDIKHDVDNINFPDLSGLSDSVNTVKTAINNITFPDLSGLSSMIDNVKSTLDNLSFPSLDQISNLLGSAKNEIRNDISFISTEISNERNNIYGHIDSVTNDLSSDLSGLIRSVKTDLSNMDVPDAASIFESFSSVESKIDSLKFPTLKNIEDSVINAAESIAEKILDKLLDGIERRYNK